MHMCIYMYIHTATVLRTTHCKKSKKALVLRQSRAELSKGRCTVTNSISPYSLENPQ